MVNTYFQHFYPSAEATSRACSRASMAALPEAATGRRSGRCRDRAPEGANAVTGRGFMTFRSNPRAPAGIHVFGLFLRPEPMVPRRAARRKVRCSPSSPGSPVKNGLRGAPGGSAPLFPRAARRGPFDLRPGRESRLSNRTRKLLLAEGRREAHTVGITAPRWSPPPSRRDCRGAAHSP